MTPTDTKPVTGVPRRPGYRERLPSRRTVTLVLMVLGTIALSTLLYVYRHDVERLGRYGYFGAFILPFIGNASVAVPFPWIFMMVPLGEVYPHVWVTIVAALGAATGEIIAYVLGARVSQSSWLATKLAKLSRPKQTALVIAISFSPVLSYPGMAAGILRYPLWVMFAIVFVGEAVKVWLLLEATGYGLHILGA